MYKRGPQCDAGALRGGGILEKRSPLFDAVGNKWAVGGTKICGMYICLAIGISPTSLGLGNAISTLTGPVSETTSAAKEIPRKIWAK